MSNRLAAESSPYLRQHADNPVEWFPWGDEAFAEARRRDKPVFVSIGYAACHWCHVMAHESFEDATTAKLMNELFINVKVDREERPDVDAIYMNAIQIMGEGGGWPLSAFCTSDGKPFFMGTYYPPADRHGRPGFPRLLQSIARIWREDRDKVDHNVAGILDGLREIDEHFRKAAAKGSLAQLDAGLLVSAGRWLAQRQDPRHGGFGSKPKFPSSSAHDMLGRAGRIKFGAPAREAYLKQATGMARGGIYDHLGGGFARYSVDEQWLVPHFEKMLYDNAQLLALYGDVWALTADADARRVIDETIEWLEREMIDPAGGLYASQDADSEGEEGKFYVWTPDEIRAVLGRADSIQFIRDYRVTERGNFEHGTTVLARVSERGGESDESALAAMRGKLFAARARRIPPATDDKILSGWNALAVSGLVRAWEATGSGPALALARRVGNFLADKMLYEGGRRIYRTWKGGTGRLEGTLDDYAFTSAAFFALAEATGDAAWWQRGAALVASVRERFLEERDGVVIFYLTPADGDSLLVHRPESNHDGAIPSGSAVTVDNLLRLGLVAGDAAALQLAERYLAGRGAQAAENPFASSRLLAALDLYLHGQCVVVSEGTGRDALLEAARRAYAPVRMLAGPWASAEVLAGKGPAADGAAQAYVCRGPVCSLPVTNPADLRALLEKPPA